MSKLKTKSSLAKRLIIRGSRVLSGNAYKRHNMRRRSKDMIRETRKLREVDRCHLRAIRRLMPYMN